MKWIYFTSFLFLMQCASEEIKEEPFMEDTSYEIYFSPCICRRQEMEIQAKKTILSQGIKDFQDFTQKEISTDLRSEILEDGYEHLLYDFSLQENLDSKSLENPITAQGKVKQKELNNFVEEKKEFSQIKAKNKSTDYGSKGLEAIKAFKSTRKKRQTVEEVSKSRPIILYEIKRR